MLSILILVLVAIVGPTPAEAVMRPVCSGVVFPHPAPISKSGYAEPVAMGCATRVRIECDSPFIATPTRTFLATGDTVWVGSLSCVPHGTRAECRLTSDQGPATIELVQR